MVQIHQLKDRNWQSGYAVCKKLTSNIGRVKVKECGKSYIMQTLIKRN